MHEDLVYQIALSKITKVGAVTGKTLIAYCGSVRAVFEEKYSNLTKIPGIGEVVANEVHKANPEELVKDDISYIQQHKIKASFFLDEDYPGRLKNFDDAPLLYYHKGNFNPNPPRTVAIVGTRKPTPYGIAECEKLVSELKAYDVQIISGLAYGVDATAHRMACQEGIENIAVMGTGMDTIYPAAHRELSHKIQKCGALITEYPIKMRVDFQNFPRRNRVIAQMADVVIIVQSANKGGSLITADFGNQYYKDVFAFPGRVNDSMSIGCNQLIKQNKAHLLESVKDIEYIMRWDLDAQQNSTIQPELFVELTEDEQLIVDLLRTSDSVSIDDLHKQSQKTLSVISTVLLTLEMKGIVQALPGSRYAIR